MRAATAADLPAMLELLRGKDLPDAGVADHLERYILEFADGQLVGCVGPELHGAGCSTALGRRERGAALERGGCATCQGATRGGEKLECNQRQLADDDG